MTQPFIVITDASSGIGEATAKAFSKAGRFLLLLPRRIGDISNQDSIKWDESIDINVKGVMNTQHRVVTSTRQEY